MAPIPRAVGTTGGIGWKESWGERPCQRRADSKAVLRLWNQPKPLQRQPQQHEGVRLQAKRSRCETRRLDLEWCEGRSVVSRALREGCARLQLRPRRPLLQTPPLLLLQLQLHQQQLLLQTRPLRLQPPPRLL